MTVPISLDQLLDDVVDSDMLTVDRVLLAQTITGLTLDSRSVNTGDAFIALPGGSAHGISHAAQAQARGAAAILFDGPLPADTVLPDRAIAVPDLRRKLGAMSNRFYGAPSAVMTVVGVTGTNGKTSTVQLLAQALAGDGLCAGTIGTLGAGLVGALQSSERTTPDVISVHRLLAQLRADGATYVAMEVSSHALDQGRVDAVEFDIAVFTNLTRDHLDYHHTMQAYGEAKAKLFVWPTLNAVVVNLDDDYSSAITANIDPGVRQILLSSQAATDATLSAEQITLTHGGMQFVLKHAYGQVHVQTQLLGRFNIDNLLAVAGVLFALDWSLEKIAAALKRLQPVPGRMSRLGGSANKPLVVIDYAHTPDALEQTLRSLQDHTHARLICVFGCGGDRDRGKRTLMASIAEKYADVVIVTDDNPRSEDGDAIVADIMTGFADRKTVAVIRNRADAIAHAIDQASADDIVLIAGKGHENYQEISGIKHPFDDLAIAASQLEQRA